MRAACNEFHLQHPDVWRLFVKFALEKAALGYDHFGVGSVFERLRWETSKGGEEPELKINNNFRAFYARRFNRMHPYLGGGEFFRTRIQVSESVPANESPQYRGV